MFAERGDTDTTHIGPAAGILEALLAGKNKNALAIVASGGNHIKGPDYEDPYLRFIFGFICVTKGSFIPSGGTASVAQGPSLR